jgi:hypothetical protein
MVEASRVFATWGLGFRVWHLNMVDASRVFATSISIQALRICSVLAERSMSLRVAARSDTPDESSGMISNMAVRRWRSGEKSTCFRV